jgi:hypothetical protein
MGGGWWWMEADRCWTLVEGRIGDMDANEWDELETVLENALGDQGAGLHGMDERDDVE